MSRVFVTGSADGLGRMAAEQLVAEGHEVVLHARSAARAADARKAVPGAADALIGDLSSLEEVRALADAANASGTFDAVIHNAGVGYQIPDRAETADGLAAVFAVNVAAPYVLTAAMRRPERLVYLSSSMHRGGKPDLDDLQWRARRWNGTQAYADSKLFDAVLSAAVARRWPGVRCNAVDPGWVPTRMGGAGATDDLAEGGRTQAWLAVSDDPAAAVSGRYFHHHAERPALPVVADETVQEGLLSALVELTGVELPA